MPGFRVVTKDSDRPPWTSTNDRSVAYGAAAELSMAGVRVAVEDDEGEAALFEAGRVVWERPAQVVCPGCDCRIVVTKSTQFCKMCGTQVA